MAVDLLYVVFRLVTGVLYASVWFISLAAYHFVLGGVRVYLIVSYRRCDREAQINCYRRIAWLLFLLNIPMGGMIILMTSVLGMENTYGQMFRYVFTPILECYQVPEQDRSYLMAFYIRGLMGVITRWVKGDCADPVEHIIGIMQQCVIRYREKG